MTSKIIDLSLIQRGQSTRSGEPTSHLPVLPALEPPLNVEDAPQSPEVDTGGHLPPPPPVGTTPVLDAVEPDTRPIEMQALLDELVDISRRFIVMPRPAFDALALWVALTWTKDAFNTAPIALIRSPEKRCGKTTLLSLLTELCYSPLSASNISTASLYHASHQFSPTLIIDEADTHLSPGSQAVGILNSGHTRQTGYVIRVESIAGVRQAVRYCTFGPKAIAAIGRLPDTIEDRSIPFILHRKLASDMVEPISQADPDGFQTIRRKLARVAQDKLLELRSQRPALIPGLNDRAQDNWRPLLAIAHVAGDSWLDRARSAAQEMSGGVETDDLSLNVQLLEDIRSVFRQRNAEAVTTREILQDLLAMEERPWRTVERGRPLTPAQLAARLRNFGVRVGTIRPDSNRETPLKGYRQEHFLEIFRRYVG